MSRVLAAGRMSAGELRHLGKTLGPDWQQIIADGIGKDRSTVNKYANDQISIGRTEALAIRQVCAESALLKRGRADACPELAGKRILVAEDHIIAAIDYAAILEEFGAIPVGPAFRLADAVRLAETEALDAAMLDVNMGYGEMIFPAAAILLKRRVPMLITTGYDEASSMFPAAMRGLPVLEKPLVAGGLCAALRGAMG